MVVEEKKFPIQVYGIKTLRKIGGKFFMVPIAFKKYVVLMF